MSDNINKYVPCRWCTNNALFDRRKSLCKSCNNSGEVIDPSTILCNMCGECSRPIGTYGDQDKYGLEATISAGYFSEELVDDTNYSFVICEKCLRTLFLNFKIKPIISHPTFVEEHMTQKELWDLDMEYYILAKLNKQK